MTVLSVHIDQIKKACTANKVKTLFAFGSATNDKFKTDSDIDLVVDIAESDPLAYSDNYFSLKEQLENIFNRRIDLLEQKAIRNPFLMKEIEKTKVLIYGT